MGTWSDMATARDVGEALDVGNGYVLLTLTRDGCWRGSLSLSGQVWGVWLVRGGAVADLGDNRLTQALNVGKMLAGWLATGGSEDSSENKCADTSVLLW